MNRQITFKGLMLFLCLSLPFANNAVAQCAWTYIYPSGTWTLPTTIGQTVNINNYQLAGDRYVTNNPVVGYAYQFGQPGINITVHTGTYNGPVVANGIAPLTVVATSTDAFHVSICGTPGSSATSITRVAPPCSNPTVPTIVQGASVSRCAGAPATTLSLTGTLNDATTWQWYEGSCGGPSAGTGTSISVSPTTTTTYYVRGTGGCVTGGTCASITVNVSQPVAITTQPTPSVEQCEGSTVNLSVAATNGASYQWYSTAFGGALTDGSGITGSGTANLQITNAQSFMSGDYYVMVNGISPCGNVQSNDAVVTINDPVNVTTQPAASLTLCEGSTINLDIVADNADGYQWYGPSGLLSDGGSTSGALSANLEINPSTMTDAGGYFAVISGLPGCLDGNTATSTVNIIPAVDITTNTPATLGVCDGADLNLSVTADNAVGYLWYGPSGALTDGGNISGATTDALTITGTTAAEAGTYYVEVTGNTPCAAVNSNTTTVTNDHPAAITTQPTDMNVCFSMGTSATVIATGANLTYEWYEGANLLSDDAIYSGTATATLTINDVTTLDGNEYHVVITGSCGSPVISDTVTLTESFDNTWTGNSDNLWGNTGNWSCGILPTSSTNVTIPNVPNFPIVNIPGAVCNNLTINTGAMVIFNGTTNVLSIHGNVQNNGTLNGNNGTIALAGATPQSVTGAVTFDDLEIDGGSTKVINGNATVNGELILTDGFLALGDNNLTITNIAAQTTGSAASYIVTDGMGEVIGQNMGADSIVFQVGLASSYNPVGIKNTGVADTFMVRVMEHVYRFGDGVNNTELVDNAVVDRTWMISEQTPGGSFASVTPQWNGAEEINGFDENHVYVAHYMNDTWTSELDSAYYAGPRLGTDPYTTMEDSITSFSPFAVASHNASAPFPLAIRLHTISAVNAGPRNKVEWKSEKEAAGDVFELERSADGRTFIKIATIAANGKPSTYLHWDENPVQGVNFYRAKLVDANGNYSYSKVVSATVKGTNDFTIEAYPNPVRSTVSVKVNGMVTGRGNVVVTDVTGKVVTTATMVENKSAELNVSHLANGIYLLNYTDDVRNESIKINKQ